eukprot:UN28257
MRTHVKSTKILSNYEIITLMHHIHYFDASCTKMKHNKMIFVGKIAHSMIKYIFNLKIGVTTYLHLFFSPIVVVQL